MFKHSLILLLASWLISGCNVGSMTSTSPSGTKNYSKYYNAGNWVTKNEVGICFVVEHTKIEIPVIYDIQRSVGALGADDMNADGRVTISVINTTEKIHKIKVERIVVAGKELQHKLNDITLMPKSTTNGSIGTVQISNFATEIPIKVHYLLDGKKGYIELKLPRRTYEELEQYHGPKGTPPYPWYKQS
jgi:hypothetical protein